MPLQCRPTQPRSPVSHATLSATGCPLTRPSLQQLRPRLGPLQRPHPSTEFSKSLPRLAALYMAVINSNLPNYRKTCEPLESNLNLAAWKQLLPEHSDTKLLHHLSYGFPLGYVAATPPQTQPINHTSTLQFPEAIDSYLTVELKHQALAGPFTQPPFQPWFHTSPMMLRNKKNSAEKRVIVDLSWPIGASVNANIPYDIYDGEQATMHLPTPDDLATAILAAPPTAYLFAIDLSRAYRQLRIDPQDWPLLGLTWKGLYYFDRALAFGGRWHAAACQRVTGATTDYPGNPEHPHLAPTSTTWQA